MIGLLRSGFVEVKKRGKGKGKRKRKEVGEWTRMLLVVVVATLRLLAHCPSSTWNLENPNSNPTPILLPSDSRTTC